MQQDWSICYLCGRNENLEEHHVFPGKNRKLSDMYGLVIHICGQRCHRCGKESVHMDAVTNRFVQAAGQEAFLRVYGSKKDFRGIFGKYYPFPEEDMAVDQDGIWKKGG